jgi:choline dehydrogenase
MDVNGSYDLIIVGAGSAGCVLAARLTEDPARRVLLLEAGPDYPDPRRLPADVADGTTLAASHDWGLRAEPEAGRPALDLPRGRLVGGCSAVNACFALRGHPGDYDGWAVRGNPGWSFADMLPAFAAVEHDLDHPDEPGHGGAGPLPIRRYPADELTPLQQMFLDAAGKAGHRSVPDHNSPGAVGAGPLPTTCVDGRRISTALAFLDPVRYRPNLHVRPGVTVDRVRLRHGQVTGVVLASGQEIAAPTVVLAAGSYASPAILLRSGIGPADELRPLGITPVLDLPGVGRNLIDHPAASIDVAVPAHWPTRPAFQTALTLHSTAADPDGPPDLQIFPSGPWMVESSPTGKVAALVAAVLKPASRGTVRLRSADPADPPRVTLAHLREPSDLARHVEAFHHARRIAATAPLRDLVTPGALLAPGPADWAADASVARWLRRHVWSYHHPVGTCAMGTDPARGAVVDRSGRVHGVVGLTVADASVMPDIPSANTNLPTIAVAHRLAGSLG